MPGHLLKQSGSIYGSGSPGVAGSGFTPASLPGYTVDFDVTRLTGLADDDPCATLTDFKGGHNATATGTAQPTYKTNVINGRPVLRFNGTSNVMATANIPLAQPNTVYIVAKPDAINVQQTYFDSTVDATQLLDIPSVNALKLRVGAGSLISTASYRLSTGFNILEVVFNGASSGIWSNGYSLAAGNAGTGGFAGISVGARGGATKLYFDGDIARMLVFNAALSSYQQSAMRAYLFGLYGSYSNRIVFDGDSLTVGTGSTGGQTYPVQCVALNGKTAANIAVAGDGTAQTLTRSLIWDYGGLVRDDIYVLWIGVNDLLASVAPATSYTNIVELVTRRLACNFHKVVVCTLPDCLATGRPAGFDAARATLNASIVGGASTTGYSVADLGANGLIGDNGDALDTTYFNADKTHMNNAGYGVVASIVDAAIRA